MTSEQNPTSRQILTAMGLLEISLPIGKSGPITAEGAVLGHKVRSIAQLLSEVPENNTQEVLDKPAPQWLMKVWQMLPAVLTGTEDTQRFFRPTYREVCYLLLGAHALEKNEVEQTNNQKRKERADRLHLAFSDLYKRIPNNEKEQPLLNEEAPAEFWNLLVNALRS